MARVTAAEVQKIIDVDSAVDVDTFILTATTLVDKVFIAAPDCDLPAACLKEIERWLTAHFLEMSNLARRTIMEKDGEAEERHQAVSGTGNFQGTNYGKTALSLDICGLLQAIDDGTQTTSFESLVPGC